MPVEAAAPAAGQVAAGLRWMTDRTSGNCTACHALPGQRGVLSSFGPSLGGVARRWSPQALRDWVTDARRLRPDTLMPPFGTTAGTLRPNAAQALLNPQQIEDILAALQSFD